MVQGASIRTKQPSKTWGTMKRILGRKPSRTPLEIRMEHPPWDGIGGVVKFLARRASLQYPAKATSSAPWRYEFGKANIAGISFMWMDQKGRLVFTGMFVP